MRDCIQPIAPQASELSTYPRIGIRNIALLEKRFEILRYTVESLLLQADLVKTRKPQDYLTVLERKS